MITLLLFNILAMAAYMSLWFLIGWRRKKFNTVDVAWGGGFVLLAWLVNYQEPTARSGLIAILITIWGLRITSHLARRVIGAEDDKRYLELSKKWKGHVWFRAYYSVFLLQGLLVAIITLPVVAATGAQYDELAVLSVFGAALWAIGFGIEAAADRQLRDFVSNKANKGLVMDMGLWRYSRHPNYFGEILQWWAIGLIALQAEHGWIGLIGPATLTFLLLFVSGVPPIENSRKHDPAYQAYKRKTSVIIPLPPRSRS